MAAWFQGLLEQGRVAEALKANPADPEDSWEESGIYALVVSLAWSLERNTAEAGQWRDRAITALETGNADAWRAAQLLRRDVASTEAELDAVYLAANSKAILLACLSVRHPARRDVLASAARRLNVERGFPYHLLQRATQPGTTAP